MTSLVDDSLGIGFALHPRPHPCYYLPDREAQDEAWLAPYLGADAYQRLMSEGFRRSGPIVYRPRCVACQACVPLRVPVARFRQSRSQRRCLRSNDDLVVRVGNPKLDDEHADLYERYVEARHPGGEQEGTREELESIVTTTLPMIEVASTAPDGRLLAVSLLDVCPGGWSSVYCYFDPEEPGRGLGTFSILVGLGLCRTRGLPWYYLGYWIAGAQTMDYKATFRPHEILIDGQWTES
ncbi:MAG: arginyltransferase [Phycisphaeraceae bacterium]|nr:arginyltransferase [Phycisphaeraceae bacterium]